jgi:hypothetical protein
MRNAGLCLLLLLFLLMSSVFLFAQTKPPASDPQAVGLATQAMTALTNGVLVNDVTLSGAVTWAVGSETETGRATFLALGTTESRMDLMLPSGTRSEIRGNSNGFPQGKWISPSGASGLYADHNCLTDPAWFFPSLGSLAAGPNIVLSFIGQESRNGQQVMHVRSNVYQDPQSVVDARLSTMDFYLDATTLLPTAAVFNVHPDDNPASDILVEIDFFNYQTVSGVTVPIHIQKYVQGALSVDFTVSTAKFNTGLSISNFEVN